MHVLLSNYTMPLAMDGIQGNSISTKMTPTEDKRKLKVYRLLKMGRMLTKKHIPIYVLLKTSAMLLSILEIMHTKFPGR